jgi:dTDP-4-amino-4,6-dideoxygalactose transaminase
MPRPDHSLRPVGRVSSARAAGRPVPFHLAYIDDRSIRAVTKVLASGELAMGRVTQEFEEEFAAYVGADYAVAVASGMAGLHLALLAIGVAPDDEVLVSDYSCPAAAAAVLHVRARPVLVDVTPGSFTLDPVQAGMLVTDRTRAILPAHFTGLPCDMDEILSLASRMKLVVIEDAAHALPARVNQRLVGGIGDMTVFDFSAGANITTGTGGMVTTDRSYFATRLRSRRVHGLKISGEAPPESGAWPEEVEYPGYDYAMSDLNAALGLEQLRKLDRLHAIRSYYAAVYRLGLSDLPAVIPPEPRPEVEHAWHFYIIQLNLEHLTIDRDTFVRALRDQNIDARVNVLPVHMQPYYREALGYAPEHFPNAFQLYRRMVSLPLYPRMSEGDVWTVIRAVRRVVQRFGRPVSR